jgi:mRNA interferase RelE/StbE
MLDRLEWLSKNLNDTKLYPLKGDLRGLYKLREGSYRIIFEVLHAEKVILVHAIGHRGEIYKQR